MNLAYTLGGSVPPANPNTPANPNAPVDPNPPNNPPSNPTSNPPARGGITFVTSQTFGTIRNNYSGFIGMQFRVGNNPITVSALGRIVAPGNTGSHLVKILDASTGIDVTGASATVATAGVAAGTLHLAR